MYRVIEFVDAGSDLGGDVTLTIAPNTTQAFFIFKNSLTADRNIIVTQGSGTNVTVPWHRKSKHCIRRWWRIRSKCDKCK